jgi:hypothetical protein
MASCERMYALSQVWQALFHIFFCNCDIGGQQDRGAGNRDGRRDATRTGRRGCLPYEFFWRRGWREFGEGKGKSVLLARPHPHLLPSADAKALADFRGEEDKSQAVAGVNPSSACIGNVVDNMLMESVFYTMHGAIAPDEVRARRSLAPPAALAGGCFFDLLGGGDGVE